MLPERKRKVSLRSLRIPGDLLQEQINPWVCPQWTPPGGSGARALHRQLRNSPVVRAVSWEKCTLAKAIPKKSISAGSRAAMTNLFSCSQQTPGRGAAQPGHLKWLFQRHKNWCWSKYYLEIAWINEAPNWCLSISLSFKPSINLLLGVHFKYPATNQHILLRE